MINRFVDSLRCPAVGFISPLFLPGHVNLRTGHDYHTKFGPLTKDFTVDENCQQPILGPKQTRLVACDRVFGDFDQGRHKPSCTFRGLKFQI